MESSLRVEEVKGWERKTREEWVNDRTKHAHDVCLLGSSFVACRLLTPEARIVRLLSRHTQA
jgi:hypothetical protein